jgi:hypothetical protein
MVLAMLDTLVMVMGLAGFSTVSIKMYLAYLRWRDRGTDANAG